MSKGHYSAGKRLREANRTRKKQEKQERLRRNRSEQRSSPDGLPMATPDEIQSLGGSISVADISPSGVAPRPPRMDKQRSARLFVGGLSWDTGDEELETAFAAYGKIVDCAVIFDRQTGRSRGFGFVTFARPEDSAKAVEEMDGAELDGRRLKVTTADERR